MAKDIFDKEFDSGTKAKLGIFKKYLSEWLPVFLLRHTWKGVWICDFFAGAGKDKSGHLGSPLLILETLCEFQELIVSQERQINILLNEKTKSKYLSLKEEVDAYLMTMGEVSKYVNVIIENDDFLNVFRSYERWLKDKNNLFFFDQNGVKFVTKELIDKLESFPRTDFLFFISSSYLKRFQFSEYLPNLHKALIDVPTEKAHIAVTEYFKSLLPPDSKTRFSPFTLKKQSNPNIYGLVFGSKHPLGTEKFQKVAWGLNPLNGEANFDIHDDKEPEQVTFDFMGRKLSKIEKFKRDLKEHFVLKDSFTNKDVLNYTLDRGHLPTHAKEALVHMRDCGLLEHFSYPKISAKAIYSKEEIVRFNCI